MDERTVNLNKFYNEDCDEEERLLSKHGSIEFITTTKYIDDLLKNGDRILEVGAGTGRYSCLKSGTDTAYTSRTEIQNLRFSIDHYFVG